MKILPGTTISLANGEVASLELDSSSPISSVTLLPRFGEQTAPEVVEGSFVPPEFPFPNSVTVEWRGESGSLEATSTLEIVSGIYFTLDQLRNYSEQDDFSELPDEVLFRAREAAIEIFEKNANRSFVQRLGFTRDYGHGELLNLAHGDVYELLSKDYQLISDSQACRVPGCHALEFPRLVEYKYGLDGIPSAVSQAVLSLTAYMLRPSNRPIGATGESSDAGYIHFTIAGRDGFTPIPEVNAVIQQFGRGFNLAW